MQIAVERERDNQTQRGTKGERSKTRKEERKYKKIIAEGKFKKRMEVERI